ncbi:anti-sigma factor [Streptomyces flaveolus]|uniref:anti-sigma factor n=1 Tax=Streptomyces flaveolus TaxID=67297 RepID=UPI0036B2A104
MTEPLAPWGGRLRRAAAPGGARIAWPAAAAGLGGTAGRPYERAQDAGDRAALAERRAHEPAGVQAAPDAESRTARPAGGASGTLAVSQRRDRAVFLASGMAEPPRGNGCRLWFDDHGTMRPAGLMDPGRASQAVLREGDIDDAAGAGITVEPAGGSPRPTTTPVAVATMPA